MSCSVHVALQRPTFVKFHTALKHLPLFVSLWEEVQTLVFFDKQAMVCYWS